MLRERLRLLSSSRGRGGLQQAAPRGKINKRRKTKQTKQNKKVLLTKGCIIANDGSDDSVDADPFARSKNEMAIRIRKHS